MNTAGVTLTCVFCLAAFGGTRLWAALALVAGTIYLTQIQRIDVAGFHFTAIRIILLVAMARVFARGEWKNFEINGIDKAVVGYALIGAAIYVLRVGTTEALVYQLGLCYDVFLAYFVFRCLISNLSDLETLLEKLAILMVPMAIIMLHEAMTGRNLLDFVGGQPPSERDGGYRCNGAFRNPMSAGTFGATLVPLFNGLVFADRKRLLPIIGIAAGVIILVASHSSGPLMAFVICLVGLVMWPMRERMRQFRWGMIFTLVGLEMVMKTHVWFLISKISDLTGGDGWYRSQLINQFIFYFKRWWLIGTDNTGDWMPTSLHIGDKVYADITNAYVNAGVNGGLLTFIFFVLIFARCFQALGRAMQSVRGTDERAEKLLWCIGGAMAAHTAALISFQYWDQLYVVWWGFVATISSVTSSVLDIKPVTDTMEEIPDAETPSDAATAF